MLALVAQLNDVQRLRVQADASLRGVQDLVATLQAEDPCPSPAPTAPLPLPLLTLPQPQPLTPQAENELLRKQNITIASETRQFLDDHRPAKGE